MFLTYLTAGQDKLCDIRRIPVQQNFKPLKVCLNIILLIKSSILYDRGLSQQMCHSNFLPWLKKVMEATFDISNLKCCQHPF